MKEYKNVHGSQVTVPELEVNVDTVYERTNLQRKSEQDEMTNTLYEYWQYDEKQYTYQEWMQTLSDQGISLVKSQELQDIDINATQEALDFLLLQSEGMPMTLMVRSTGSGLESYISIRIMKKGKISEEAGQNEYRKFLIDSDKFADLKEKVNAILIENNCENLIVK